MEQRRRKQPRWDPIAQDIEKEEVLVSSVEDMTELLARADAIISAVTEAAEVAKPDAATMLDRAAALGVRQKFGGWADGQRVCANTALMKLLRGDYR